MQTILKEILNKLTFIKIKFHLVFEKDTSLPEYHGSMIRGFFGNSLKNMVCKVKDTECKNCFLKDECIYPYLFETIQNDAYSVMKSADNLPHPYIIEPESFDGKNLYFNLILIGKSINFLSYIIYSFMSGYLGKKDQTFYLKSVYSENKKELNKIYDYQEKILKKNFTPLTIANLDYQNTDTIELEFLTPTRIKFNGKYSDNIDFNYFIKNLTRRLLLLSCIHSETDNTDKLLKSIVEGSEKVETVNKSLYLDKIKRYSSRSDKSMELYGFKGKMTFRGDISKFIPLVTLGEFLHVGNCTAFGLGRYKIINKSLHNE